MKKMLLGAVGLSAVLASCGVDMVGYGPVTLTAVNSFTSDWYRVVTDPNTGQARNEYVICNDERTTVTMDVSWTGPLSQLAAEFEGANTRETTQKVTDRFAADYSGRDQFTYSFNPGMAPLSMNKGSTPNLKAQAIIVNPTNLGTTYLTVWGYNPDGVQSDTITVPQGIPVVNCTP